MKEAVKTRSRQEHLDSVLRPIIDKDAGYRFSTIRMSMLLDQSQVGEFLGMKQQQVSALERGRLDCVPFTFARFKAVFADTWGFILLGTGVGAKIPADFVAKKYWNSRLKNNRKPGSGKWKTKRFGQ